MDEEMREIKFRAWHKKEKEMKVVIGLELRTKEIRVSEKEWWFMNYAILMQYTGLKDKNGKEIYEGDIVWSGGHRLQFITEYQLSMGGFMFCSEGLLMGVGQNADGMEIIGNIYENPELMKEK